jgi:hypothetical protein
MKTKTAVLISPDKMRKIRKDAIVEANQKNNDGKILTTIVAYRQRSFTINELVKILKEGYEIDAYRDIDIGSTSFKIVKCEHGNDYYIEATCYRKANKDELDKEISRIYNKKIAKIKREITIMKNLKKKYGDA